MGTSEIFKELLCNDTSSCIDRQFHLADLLIDLLHKVDDKVHQLMFIHLLRVEVGNQKANVIALNRLSSQNKKVFSSHHHEAHEFMAKDFFDLISLLDSDADSDRVDGSLDKNLLLVITADHYRLK